MKAVEFVKKFGLDRAKQHIKAMDIQNWHNDFYNNLKRLVESHELVESFGGIANSRIKVQGNRLSYKKTAILWEAIADVESCQ